MSLIQSAAQLGVWVSRISTEYSILNLVNKPSLAFNFNAKDRRYRSEHSALLRQANSMEL